MPVDITENYIRIRVRDPGDFVDGSFRTVSISDKEGIKTIMGKLKSDPNGSMVVQSYLFDKEKWTVSEAKKWVSDHKKSKLESEVNMEKRTFDASLEFRTDYVPKLRGHAAVFDTIGDGGWFEEQIAPGAFTNSIKKDDVRATFNHDPNYVLGRNGTGTLSLVEDEKGLYVEIDPPDTQLVRDLVLSPVVRGDISQMSFAFAIIRDSWEKREDKKDLRTLEEVKLYDVSVVTYPFYEQTDVALRSHEQWQKRMTPLKYRPFETELRRRKLNLKIRRR